MGEGGGMEEEEEEEQEEGGKRGSQRSIAFLVEVRFPRFFSGLKAHPATEMVLLLLLLLCWLLLASSRAACGSSQTNSRLQRDLSGSFPCQGLPPYLWLFGLKSTCSYWGAALAVLAAAAS